MQTTEFILSALFAACLFYAVNRRRAVARVQIVIGALIISSMLFSCNTDFENDNVPTESRNLKALQYDNVPWDEKGKMMEKFATGISKALHNQKFRELVKREALKKFNKDYDVLYHSIKNVPLSGKVTYRLMSDQDQTVDFSTLHDFLIPFFESEQELLDFEMRLPLLTIFVPELPLDMFSADSWDISDPDQIPDVAIRLDNITYTPVIGRDGFNYLIAPEDTPGWAVVVLKENERVVANNDPQFNELETRIIQTDPIDFRFVDNNLDPAYVSSSNDFGFRGASDDYIPQNLITAHQVFNNDREAWHRDYIYYSLTPTNLTGPMNNAYREHIATFRMKGDSPRNAYNRIADSFDETKRDPALKDWQRRKYGATAWTDGSFEFLIRCYYGANASSLGESVSKVFGVSPGSLFDISWEQKRTGWSFWRKYWLRPYVSGTKVFNTAMPDSGVRLEFQPWDLNDFSNHWKFTFEEQDATSTTTRTEVVQSKFNTNLSLETTTGLLKKIGLKFGASYERSQSSTFNYLFYGGNDDLGGATISFKDNPVNRVENRYVLRRFDTGSVEFSLVPLQVEY
ncbi:hypothetical protein ACR78G_20095 [Sphingobacterium spiritivorum]|uniref:hypothetical protein n=1 Tax=Sphingobacterium spiritivorum TaxID=258 RepID=UPI003DA37A40